VPGLGTSFGRGGATTFQQDLQNADCIVIQGSNMAECHPVGFQWVMEAKERGAKVIHVDPRYTRTSAMADLHVPIRAGADVAFLGAIVNHILEDGREFREYVQHYTNGPVVIKDEFADTEDLDGFFSGWNPDRGLYDIRSWGYAGTEQETAAGKTEQAAEVSGEQAHGAHGMKLTGGRPPEVDIDMQHPRCVLQILRRHFSRYTPELVEEVCGVPRQLFLEVAETLCENSGPERTSAFCYAVGWTQHTVGVQYIRTAAIVQLLLGNMGRPGGGILALRGHANIQGSTDIPTLFNILPGYIPMPHPQSHGHLGEFVEKNGPDTGAWGALSSYMTSLLKAWWGDAATEESDFAFDYLPRINGDHSAYSTFDRMLDGKVKGLFAVGQNPAVGSANSKLHRLAMTKLDWLVVRDTAMVETATFWKDGPEIETGELRAEDVGTEVFFLPAAAHTEKDGSFTNTQRLLQWHHKAVEPPQDCRSELHFFFHLGRKIREKLAGSRERRDRPILDLAWDYPLLPPHAEPDPDAVLMEIGGRDAEGNPLPAYQELKADGSTTCGSWIHCGIYKDGVNQTKRKRPGAEQDWVAREWAWAWPADTRLLYNRASARPDGRPWSERKRYVWWDPEQEQWTGVDHPDIAPLDKPPDYTPGRKEKTGVEALRGTAPFIVHPDGLGWLFVPAGLVDGPLPAHYEPHESPVPNPLYGQQQNPARQRFHRPENPYNPTGDEPGAGVFPYVVSSWRLTEHHTAGGMSRGVPYLAELQPELFCELSPSLGEERGLEHGGWATIVTARSAIEARVLVTDRVKPLRVSGRVIHQVGLPYHYGRNGIATGDTVNDLFPLALDPNVHIQEVKCATCDVRPGRRPRGPALLELVERYRQEAGVIMDVDEAYEERVEGGGVPKGERR
jgi:formate dehydrogenase major subunit